MRWSFRKSLEMGPWESRYPPNVIQHGDEVYLFSHSMMLGLFREPEAQPRVGSPVCLNASKSQIKAFSPATYWSWTELYDEEKTDQHDTDLGVLVSKIAGNAVAAEAEAMVATTADVRPWLDAFDEAAKTEAANKLAPLVGAMTLKAISGSGLLAGSGFGGLDRLRAWTLFRGRGRAVWRWVRV